MANNPNMALWNQVCVTDPAAVKPITGKPYKGNSPKPYWLIQRATEVFGPCGEGWGVEVKSEGFHRMTETDVMHSAVVVVWYMKDGKRCHVEQMGQTKACYAKSGGGMMVDEDAGKKSITDGMVKCLSMIGFAGDIFSGRWDDSNYVEWARHQYEEPDPLAIFTANLAQLHEEGNTLEAVRLWYAPESRNGVLSTNEAIEIAWSQLRDYSALRSAIKANKPEKVAA